MKNNVSKLKVRWRARKTIFWFTSVILCGLLIAILFSAWFSKYTEKIWLLISNSTAIIISVIIFMVTYLIIYIKSRKQMYHIDLERKEINIGKKILRYSTVYRRKETIFQKIFGLTTLKFENKEKKIIMKDVNKIILNYIETV